MSTRTCAPAMLVLILSAPAAAQVITVRTVPVARTHQFDLYPSLTGAMGGIGIAIDDTLLDPFVNPAKGARARAIRFFSAPARYGVADGAEVGRTLPLGALGRSGAWFGAAAVTVQQVDLGNQFGFGVPVACDACAGVGLNPNAPDPHHGNRFGYAMLGHAFPSGVSVAASISGNSLTWVHGVDRLYTGSSQIQQRGHGVDVRLAALKEWDDHRSLTATVLRNRWTGTHDVLFVEQIWDPGTQQTGLRSRVEENLDQTSLWGLHLQLTQPVPTTRWQLGLIATGNLLSHPKIPNYVFQNIPRDPGASQAFNFGVGLSKREDRSTLGIEAVYEPIWSNTWADRTMPVTTATGQVIPAGGKTVENWFRFSNAIIRFGYGSEYPVSPQALLGIRFGMAMHRFNYRLEQQDYVAASARTRPWRTKAATWAAS